MNYISDRERWLMGQAMYAASVFKNVDAWLTAISDDDGHTVEQTLSDDAAKRFNNKDIVRAANFGQKPHQIC